MKPVLVLLQLACVLMLATAATRVLAATPSEEVIDHGRFHGLHLLRPDGDARSTVLLLSGRNGWDAQSAAYAETLRDNATLVAGIDTPALLAELAKDGDDCEFLDGDLDNLSHFVQAYTHQDDYRPPLVFGVDDAAALAFGVLAQAPANSFAGGIGVGFCPQSVLRPPLCAGTALRQRVTKTRTELLPSSRLREPFYAIVTPQSTDCGARAFVDRVPDAELRWPLRRRTGSPSVPAAAVVAYLSLAADVVPTQRKPDALPDLPLVEIPARVANPQYPDLFAVLISGDGGWAGIDEELANRLAAQGIPVVGMDSLRYFWSEREPAGLAADLDRLVAHYVDAWDRPRVLLLGYSQGADVLPFALNRLADTTRSHLALAGAIALSQHAAFEFHVGAWAGGTGDFETLPEVKKLADRTDLLIICGDGDDAAICPLLDSHHYRLVHLPGSHHFNGDYALLARTLLDALPPPVAGR